MKFSKNTIIQPNIRNIARINSNKPKRPNIQNLETYKKVLGNEMSQHNIAPIMNKLDENPDNINILNEITTMLTQLYTNAANKLKIFGKTKPNKNRKSGNKKPWYNNDCKILKRKLNQLGKSLSRRPNHYPSRIFFYHTQKSYKKLMKHKRREYEEQLTSKMENLYYQNKNEFWKFLKTMKSEIQDEKLPELDSLVHHFKMLYNKEEFPHDLTSQTHNVNIDDVKKFESLNEVFK